MTIDSCSIVIPTYYPGKIINNLFYSLPITKDIIVLDNSNDKELYELIKKKFNFIKYYNLGDVGLSKTFNYALEICKTNNIFITQPDVILRENCLENLLSAKKKYSNGAIFSPLVFTGEEYCYYDSPPLPLDDNFKLKYTNVSYLHKSIPLKDVIVEAVTSTAILIDKSKIKEIGGWDNFYYTYLEDIDLSLNVRKKGYKIYKIKNAIVDHLPFSSHDKKIHKTINLKRVENFTRSSIYFKKKFSKKKDFLVYYFSSLFKIFSKFIFCFVFFQKNKFLLNKIKLKQFLYFLINEKKNI